MGEKKLSDGKTIGGKGRLTDAIISKLTTFYGNAIRANSHNVNEMRQAVWAVWAHTSSTDDEPKHWFCPKAKIAGVLWGHCYQRCTLKASDAGIRTSLSLKRRGQHLSGIPLLQTSTLRQRENSTGDLDHPTSYNGAIMPSPQRRPLNFEPKPIELYTYYISKASFNCHNMST
ncbi:uncharacterized protein TNCV_4459011 [Trichonephila clavipes]|nr:uncharacterized protein TNCV_4459011 [Trichonephila clavipes]